VALSPACEYIFRSKVRPQSCIGIVFVNEIMEQPWGLKEFRLYDPDHYMVEIGEPMDPET
jgi:hypothetical protein